MPGKRHAHYIERVHQRRRKWIAPRFEVWLESFAPEKPYSQYKHNGFEDNADAHLKRTIMGREVVVAVTNGKLDFGPGTNFLR